MQARVIQQLCNPIQTSLDYMLQLTKIFRPLPLIVYFKFRGHIIMVAYFLNLKDLYLQVNTYKSEIKL